MTPMSIRRTVSRVDREASTVAAVAAPRGWSVCWRGEDVLEIAERPGHLRSTATPPPGWIAPSHPFIDATSLDHRHEHRLRGYLLASHTLPEFLDRLVAAGYDLAPDTLEHWDMADAVRVYRDHQLVATAWHVAGPQRELHRAEADVIAPRAVTIYDPSVAAELRALASHEGDFDAFLASLDAAGFRWRRVID